MFADPLDPVTQMPSIQPLPMLFLLTDTVTEK